MCCCLYLTFDQQAVFSVARITGVANLPPRMWSIAQKSISFYLPGLLDWELNLGPGGTKLMPCHWAIHPLCPLPFINEHPLLSSLKGISQQSKNKTKTKQTRLFSIGTNRLWSMTTEKCCSPVGKVLHFLAAQATPSNSISIITYLAPVHLVQSIARYS